MKIILKAIAAVLSVFLSMSAVGGGFAEGVPVSVQKTDYGTLHLIFISLENPISLKTSCSSNDGLVVEDENQSSKAALSMALTALASGSKFRCYVENGCSAANGASTTYPICSYYPTLVK